MKDHQEEMFEYTYSAQRQEELKRIRSRYLPKEEDKMEQLRRMDQSVTKKGTALSLALGVIGALVMGTGMSCCMVWGDALFVPGIVIGIIGMALVAAAYPVYKNVTEKEREKIAPEILRLSEELMR